MIMSSVVDDRAEVRLLTRDRENPSGANGGAGGGKEKRKKVKKVSYFSDESGEEDSSQISEVDTYAHIPVASICRRLLLPFPSCLLLPLRHRYLQPQSSYPDSTFRI